MLEPFYAVLIKTITYLATQKIQFKSNQLSSYMCTTLNNRAVVLHLLGIVFGAQWYLAMGAGQEMANLASAGHLSNRRYQFNFSHTLYLGTICAVGSKGDNIVTIVQIGIITDIFSVNFTCGTLSLLSTVFPRQQRGILVCQLGGMFDFGVALWPRRLASVKMDMMLVISN